LQRDGKKLVKTTAQALVTIEIGCKSKRRQKIRWGDYDARRVGTTETQVAQDSWSK